MATFLLKMRVLLSYIPWLLHLLYYRFSDPCIEAGQGEVVTYAAALRCYDSFPLLYDLEAQTLETLAKGASIDVQGRDMEALVARVAGQRHLAEHKFQRDLMVGYNGMRDANYQYTSQCFSSFEFVQPFPLELVGGELRIARNFRHHAKLMQRWVSHEIEIYKYTGSRVVEIDGLPALDYLASYALDHVGATHDPHARLALAHARAKFQHGRWAIAEGAFMRTRIAPRTPHLTLKIVYMNATRRIRAPYLAISPRNFHSRASFYYHNCLVPRATVSKYSPEFWLPTNLTIKQTGLVTAYQRGQNGIVKIQEWRKADPASQLKDAVYALESLKSRNISKLIIDLSDSAGRGVCFAQLLAQTLFARRAGVWSHFRHSPLLDLLMENVTAASFLGADFSYDAVNITPKSFLKSKHHYRARSHRFFAYTPPLLERCPHEAPFYPGLVPGEVAIVTNGLCFGACAMFASQVATLPAVKTFRTGGMGRYPALLASSPDFESIDIGKVSGALRPSPNAPSARHVPADFPVMARLTVPAREFLHNQTGFPLRFQSLPAHRQIAHQPTRLPFDAWELIFSLM